MSDPAPAGSSPKANGHMSDEMLAKVCTTFALIYLAFCIYFLSAGQGWGFSIELLIKSDRKIEGPITGLFGTPFCALLFLTLMWLMKQWTQRRIATSLWDRFPVPFHREIPYADPVGRAYRVVFFALIFGFGPYVQGYVFNSFVHGNVCTDIEWPVPAQVAASDGKPTARLKAEPKRTCKNGVSIINEPWGHFTAGFGPLTGNDFHFHQNSGLTYFPGWQPYLFLLLTAAVFVTWYIAIRVWVIAALSRFSRGLVKGCRKAMDWAGQLRVNVPSRQAKKRANGKSAR